MQDRQRGVRHGERIQQGVIDRIEKSHASHAGGLSQPDRLFKHLVKGARPGGTVIAMICPGDNRDLTERQPLPEGEDRLPALFLNQHILEATFAPLNGHKGLQFQGSGVRILEDAAVFGAHPEITAVQSPLPFKLGNARLVELREVTGVRFRSLVQRQSIEMSRRQAQQDDKQAQADKEPENRLPGDGQLELIYCVRPDHRESTTCSMIRACAAALPSLVMRKNRSVSLSWRVDSLPSRL